MLVAFHSFRRRLRDVKPLARAHTARCWWSWVSSCFSPPLGSVCPIADLVILPLQGWGFLMLGDGVLERNLRRGGKEYC